MWRTDAYGVSGVVPACLRLEPLSRTATAQLLLNLSQRRIRLKEVEHLGGDTALANLERHPFVAALGGIPRTIVLGAQLVRDDVSLDAALEELRKRQVLDAIASLPQTTRSGS